MAPPRAPPAAADGGIEENAMAILDTFGIKDSRDLHDDRAAFLEAVRSTCLAGDNPSAPSWRMYNAVFQILRSSSSLELTISSFHLLTELGKQYPRAYLTNSGPHQALVIAKESWSPFLLGNDVSCGEIGGNASRLDHLFDSSRFSLLIEDMVEAANDTDTNNGLKHIKNMLLFQYLVSTLEADFVPRHIAYKESLDWVIFRESLLNVLLASRKLVFKTLVKNCISLLLNKYHQEVEDNISSKEDYPKSASDLDSSLTFASLEIERKTLLSVQKLFIMVINLDLIRKEADKLGLTSRADGFRNPILEVILDELTYNISYLSPFLLAFMEWKWKLEIILQYFSKYCVKVQPNRLNYLEFGQNENEFEFRNDHLVLTACASICRLANISCEPASSESQPAVRTRRSDNPQQDLTIASVLSLFSTATSAKAIVKKMGPEVAQLLLAHAYQVCLSVQGDSSTTNDATQMIGATLLQISCNFVSAFQNLRKINPNIQISRFEKEALFTAATLTRKLQNE